MVAVSKRTTFLEHMERFNNRIFERVIKELTKGRNTETSVVKKRLNHACVETRRQNLNDDENGSSRKHFFPNM